MNRLEPNGTLGPQHREHDQYDQSDMSDPSDPSDPSDRLHQPTDPGETSSPRRTGRDRLQALGFPARARAGEPTIRAGTSATLPPTAWHRRIAEPMV